MIWRGEYRAWDCHNEWFGVSNTYRLDGHAYGLELDKVIGSALLDAYQTLPGFEDADISQCWYREGPCDPDCEQTAFRNIELQIFSGASSAPEYRFVRRTEENPVDVRYRVEPGEAPQLVRSRRWAEKPRVGSVRSSITSFRIEPAVRRLEDIGAV